MRKFHHIGLVAGQPMAGETYVESLRVWVTDPSKDANLIEWVRFGAGAPLAATAVAKMPHVAFQVDDLDAALKGKQVVVAPLAPMPGLRIAYFMEDGGLVEYMEVKGA